MKRMVKKQLFAGLAAVLLLSFSACSGGSGGGSLAMVSATTSVGAQNGDTQIISYTAVLQNKSANSVYIESMEPVPSASLAPKVLADNLIRGVSKNVVSGQTLEIRGSFPFDAKGMTKEDIDKLAPFITGYSFIYHETVPAPGR